MATNVPLPEVLQRSPPGDFVPKNYRANLDELARQIGDGGSPLVGVADALANLKFHELMTMVNAIVGDKLVVETPYDLASALNVWALKQLSKD